ncbi:MAG TPA: chemotaxis response regulator protein-glutamate methylesterase [Spongiibacteraceae bacterium]|jgi:chemosensory pili system protein ChpB (putative protein-glutamate methylesterase)|nr:chemotaxis response regulator protein-glutamate methylesterase [Spongiibacteraceae bacterium]HUH36758.1 chemotaxis response regulator protein-glutamate methylesterase [Spongiibacteraceae bacterium]
MASDTPQVVVVADEDLHRHTLANVLRQAGFRVDHAVDGAGLDLLLSRPELPAIGAWLIDLWGAGDEARVARILEASDAPLMFNEGMPGNTDPFAIATWQRRLVDKTEELLGDPRQWQAGAQAVADVWVLAASIGGPEAVSRFLNALPAGLPLTLVYAQHIDPQFDALLADKVARKQHYPLQLCRGARQLSPGQVLVVPADHQLRFLPFDRVIETRKAWPGRYQPAIDQVIAELARLYRQRCRVIVFTGMCDDGAIGARVVQACGGEVWVQSPDSCVSPQMVEAALATGAVSRQGSPEELAAALTMLYPSPAAGTPAGIAARTNEISP